MTNISWRREILLYAQNTANRLLMPDHCHGQDPVESFITIPLDPVDEHRYQHRRKCAMHALWCIAGACADNQTRLVAG